LDESRSCYRSWLLAFWAFIRREWNIFSTKISCSKKSILSGFLMPWMMIKSQKGFDSEPSSCDS
jgi:hypothetical protein